MKLKTISIHPSQFPEAVQRDLIASLRTRAINHKFHYESVKQAAKWLALHEAYSPARRDPTCLDSYAEAFRRVVELVSAENVRVIGLGCGGGKKEAVLLQLLQTRGKRISYAPMDVSVPLVLTAMDEAAGSVSTLQGVPIPEHPEGWTPNGVVCDLQTATDLCEVLEINPQPSTPNILTFFGLIPNFEPDLILPRLSELVRPGDWLLFSANLAPGEDYAESVQRILPQYDNALTRDWLMTLLHDLGIEAADGDLRFGVEMGAMSLMRIMARFHFGISRQVRVYGESVEFAAGESLQVFFSYRYSTRHVQECLARHGLAIQDTFLNANGEEGVFLCRRFR